MNKIIYLLALAITSFFVGCDTLNKEELLATNQESQHHSSMSRVYAFEDISVKSAPSRAENGLPGSSAPIIQYTGGRLEGCGWYAQKEVPIIHAYANPGYEVEYCYGERLNRPGSKEYDYAKRGNGISFVVDSEDVVFYCKFRPSSERYVLHVQQSVGGTASVSRSGYIHSLYETSVVCEPGYEFSGWELIDGNANIKDPSNPKTEVLLKDRSSTIRPIYRRTTVPIYLYIKQYWVALEQDDTSRIKFGLWLSDETLTFRVTEYERSYTDRDGGSGSGSWTGGDAYPFDLSTQEALFILYSKEKSIRLGSVLYEDYVSFTERTISDITVYDSSEGEEYMYPIDTSKGTINAIKSALDGKMIYSSTRDNIPITYVIKVKEV